MGSMTCAVLRAASWLDDTRSQFEPHLHSILSLSFLSLVLQSIVIIMSKAFGSGLPSQSPASDLKTNRFMSLEFTYPSAISWSRVQSLDDSRPRPTNNESVQSQHPHTASVICYRLLSIDSGSLNRRLQKTGNCSAWPLKARNYTLSSL